MHVGDNIVCCKKRDGSSSHSDSMTPLWKKEIKSLFSVTDHHFYINVDFFTCNKHSYVRSAYLYRKSRFCSGFQPNFYRRLA